MLSGCFQNSSILSSIGFRFFLLSMIFNALYSFKKFIINSLGCQWFCVHLHFFLKILNFLFSLTVSLHDLTEEGRYIRLLELPTLSCAVNAHLKFLQPQFDVFLSLCYLLNFPWHSGSAQLE